MDLKFKDNSKLSLGYAQLEYIESTGTQYIDTGFKPLVNDEFEISYMITGTTGYYNSVFGTRVNSQSNAFMFGYTYSGSYIEIGNQNIQSLNKGYSQNVKHTIKLESGNLYVDNVLDRSITVNQNTVHDLLLFTLNSNGTPSEFGKCRIYNFTIKRAGVKVLDLIPANKDNILCIYDTVSKTFFYNQGTGDFIAGPIVKHILPDDILLKTNTLYHKNIPNVDGLLLLNSIFNAQKTAEDVVLNRIRVDIGDVSGSISELMQYSSMAGFNDAGEEQAKPRLVGTWIINDWYTQEQLVQAQGAFDGLTIAADPNYLINFDDMAVQVLDDTQPNYNPAVAIRLQANNIGNLIPQPLISGKGKWFINKSQAASLTTIPTCNFRTITDSNGIVSNDTTATYNFISFNEFVYFTGITTLPNGMFNGAWSCPFFKLPDSIVTTSWCWQGWDNGATCVAEIPSSIQNYSALFGYNQNNGATSCAYRLHFNHLIPPTLNNVIHQAANNIIFYVGNGESKINDSKALELFKSANYWKQYSLRSWYDFAAPKVVYDGSNVTITVENTSTIYYTTDGSTPSENSTQYSAPFAWDGQGVIKAIAIDNYDRRTQAEPFYAQTVSNPTFTIDTTNNQVIINCATPGATIYYTTDGTYPTTDSYIYSAPITSQENIIKVRCFATIQGYNNSEVVSKTCVMDDSLWGTDGDTSSFAVQCMDATKPNYNPAVCIVLDNNGKLSDKCYNGGGGYITKTDAAAITSIGTWFKQKVSVTDANGIVSSDIIETFDFEYFNEIEYFTSITQIENQQFSSCSKLKSISFNNIRTIGASAFLACQALEIELSAPNLVSLSNYAFGGNAAGGTGAGIKKIIDLGSITSIPEACFQGCIKLESVLLSNNITTLGKNSFNNCRSLKTITMPSNLTSIGWGCFNYCDNLELDFTNLPQTITSIENGSFVGCRKISGDLNLPNLTHLGEYVFLGNAAAQSGAGIQQILNLGSITSLGTNVCYACYRLTYVVIPPTVTSIGSECFASAKQLNVVKIEPSNPPSISTNTFNDIKSTCKFYVGDGSSAAHDDEILADYLADTNWATYSSRLDTWYNYLHPTT